MSNESSTIHTIQFSGSGVFNPDVLDATHKQLDAVEADSSIEAVFLRDNPRGKHVELWHHINGCRMVLRVERDTQTHIISKVEAAHPAWREGAAGSAAKPARKSKVKAGK